MSASISLSNTISIELEVVPYVIHNLETVGFAVVKLPQSAHLASELLVVGSLVGRKLGSHLSYHFLEGESEQTYLAAHTEGIAYTSGIVPYFALGCIQPASVGGATRVFDARKAASFVREKGMAEVSIEYGSLAHPDQVIQHPLVINDPVYGDVLRYRAKVVTNRVPLGHFPEDVVYDTVSEVLEESVSHTHSWEVGDLMFVNNKITLHDRLPYKGRRSMLRVRYDDGLHRNFRF